MIISEVIVEEGEPLEKAIRRFRKKVEKEAIIREWKRHEHYEKPSTIRNRKKKAIERKRLRKLSKQKKNNN
jgi:small subunit ribosomal protein S21